MRRLKSVMPCGSGVAVGLGIICLLSLAGCKGLGGAITRPTGNDEPRQIATREELTNQLKANMGRLATLTAKMRTLVVRQDLLVPAGVKDVLRYERGKPYKKKFLRFEVTSQLLLARNPHGNKHVRFSGQIVGRGISFDFLGKDDKFRISMPNLERSAGEGAPAGFVYVG